MPNEDQNTTTRITDISENIRTHIDSLATKIGPDAKTDLEDLVKDLVTEIREASLTNPSEASSMFLARPTGYVI